MLIKFHFLAQCSSFVTAPVSAHSFNSRDLDRPSSLLSDLSFRQSALDAAWNPWILDFTIGCSVLSLVLSPDHRLLCLHGCHRWPRLEPDSRLSYHARTWLILCRVGLSEYDGAGDNKPHTLQT